MIVQLIEADSDTHQWAVTFDRQSDPKDLFAMRSELSEAIAAAMQAQLDIKPVNGTHSPLALEAYYRGRQLLFRGGVERLEEAMQSGRPRLGERLVAESTRYLLEQLPASRDHVDRYKPDLCHLASGEPELALASIEQHAAPGHIALWDDWHRLPLYEAIRNEERYKAAVAQRERLLSAERRQAGLP